MFAQAWKVLDYRGLSWTLWEIKYALKILENYCKAFQSPWILLFSIEPNAVDRDLNQYKIGVPLFGAAYAAPNKGTIILY